MERCVRNGEMCMYFVYDFNRRWLKDSNDALRSSLLNPFESPSVLNCGNMELGGAPDFQH
jgi:hypothetical protein